MRTSIVMLVGGVVVCGTLGCATPEADPPSAAPETLAVSLQVATPASLPKCTSALAGTTAYVASPAGLWSCAGDAWGQVPCTKQLAGAVAYASATQTLWACTSGQWTAIALPAGATGPMGQPGGTGAASLIAQTPEPAGSNCGSGGTRVQSGLDVDGDGVLDSAEVMATTFVCNGADGEDPIAGMACQSLGISGTYSVGVDGEGFVKATCVIPPPDPQQCRGVDVTNTPHGTWTCPNYDPRFVSCEPGYVDLDGLPGNGCETKNLVADGGFEHLDVNDGWLSNGISLGCEFPRTGASCLRLSNSQYTYQGITIPADASAIRFWYTSTGIFLLGQPGATPERHSFASATYGAYEQAVVSLDSYRGQTIIIAFSADTTGNPMFVDDVTID